MSKKIFIGLGGSGGQIIQSLYKSLKERGEAAKIDDVVCIVIDTERKALEKLNEPNLKTICISSNDTVGQAISDLLEDDEDLSLWCPVDANDENFHGSLLDNGASQIRLKSRLALAKYLKNDFNDFSNAIQEAINTGDTSATAPRILIASSIAGGTGSGIFIQVALYIRKMFEDKGKAVNIDGLFACPDLYLEELDDDQRKQVMANSYAVVRELNAFSAISGKGAKTNLGVDMEISSKAEGSLFVKDEDGTYSHKPFDMMYFVDKTNTMSKVLGGLPKYYEIMAGMAYTMMYSNAAGVLDARNSNVSRTQGLCPMAIYGSSGAADLVYPFTDILKYASNRAVLASVEKVWSHIDDLWEQQLEYKSENEAAKGGKYIPDKDEREQHYIEKFEEIAAKEFSESAYRSIVDQAINGDISVAVAYEDFLKKKAERLVSQNARIKKEKENRSFDDLGLIQSNVVQAVKNTPKDQNKGVFRDVENIEDSLEEYCKNCIKIVGNMAGEFANSIICPNEDFCSGEDGLIKKLLRTEKGEWVHPVAARYSLYLFRNRIKSFLATNMDGIDTPDDDVRDFYVAMVKMVEEHRQNALGREDDSRSASVVLDSVLNTRIFPKLRAKSNIEQYFAILSNFLESLDKFMETALLCFTYSIVELRLDRLIAEYETFFGNIKELKKKLENKIASLEKSHAKAAGTALYVCADESSKQKFYKENEKIIGIDNGVIASNVAQAVFNLVFKKTKEEKKADTVESLARSKASLNAVYDSIIDVVYNNFIKDKTITSAFNLDVFSALRKEFDLKNPKCENYKDKFNKFVNDKFRKLIEHSSPFLLYNLKNPYKVNTEESSGNKDYSLSYVLFTHGSDVKEGVLTFAESDSATAGDAEVQKFYRERIKEMPEVLTESDDPVTFVLDDTVNKYRLSCFYILQCLQAYQINNFDETRGEKLYQAYLEAIKTVEETKKYSLTPHLDIRWHKSGHLPYINPKVQGEKKITLAKAFLYGIVTGKIGYGTKRGSKDIFFTVYDSIKGAPTFMRYAGLPIPSTLPNRAFYYLSEREFLCEEYAAKLDEMVKDEIENSMGKIDDIGAYEAYLTRTSKVLGTLRKNAISTVEVTTALTTKKTKKTAKTAKTDKNPSVSVVNLAAKIHNTEEKEIDNDYGELLLQVLCDIVTRYAVAPFGKAADLDDGDAKNQYEHVMNHILKQFADKFEGVSKDANWFTDVFKAKFAEYTGTVKDDAGKEKPSKKTTKKAVKKSSKK